MEHIVNYHKWCPLCKHCDKNENKDPCEECLTYPVNDDSRKPINFEKKTETKGSVKKNGTRNTFVSNH